MLTWTASNGSTIEIEAKVGMSGAILVARLDGKEMASVYGASTLKTPVSANGQTVVASVGKIGLNAERYEIVKAMYAAVKAEHANTPEGLEATRRGLADDLNAIRAEADYAGRGRVERAMATGVDKGGVDLSAKEQAASDALAAFDAAHPEIIEAIRAEKSAAAKRFAEID